MTHYETFCMLRDYRDPGVDAPKYTEAQAFQMAGFAPDLLLHKLDLYTKYLGARTNDVITAIHGITTAVQQPMTIADLMNAGRWIFMMATADNPDGPEAKALEAADLEIPADDIAMSAHLATVIDAAILISKGCAR